MKIRGEKITTFKKKPSPRPGTSATRTSLDSQTGTTFLLRSEPSLGVGGVVARPSIHHFCVEPQSPQLPIPMQVLSRLTHANPNYPKSGQSITEKETKSPEKSTVDGISARSRDTRSTNLPITSRSTTTTGTTTAAESKLGSNSIQRFSRNQTTPLTASCVMGTTAADESDDIVSMAKARLKREQKEPRPDTSSTLQLPEGAKKSKSVPLVSVKPSTKDSKRKGEASRRSLRSSQAKRDGDKLKGSSKKEENEMKLTGIKMKVVQDPSRLVYRARLVYKLE